MPTPPDAPYVDNAADLDALVKAALRDDNTTIDRLLDPILTDPVRGYAYVRTLAELAVPGARGASEGIELVVPPEFDKTNQPAFMAAKLLNAVAADQKQTADDLASVAAFFGPDFCRAVIHCLLEIVAGNLKYGDMGGQS